MSIPLERRYQFAFDTDTFRHRIIAAMFIAAQTKWFAAPLDDPVKQGQRMVFVKQMVLNGSIYVAPFIWAVVSQDWSTEDELQDDATLVGAVLTVLDPLASVLVDPNTLALSPPPVVVP
jgi:hypothetical protein